MSEELYTIGYSLKSRAELSGPTGSPTCSWTRKLAEPRLRLGGRRVFTNGDAKRVAKPLGLTWQNEEGKEDANEQQQ